MALRPGTAPVKAEQVHASLKSSFAHLFFRYLLSVDAPSVPDDDAAEGSTSHVNGRDSNRNGQASEDTRGKKRSKEEKKAQRGANKGRRYGKVRDDLELCWKIASGRICEFGSQ